MPLSPAALPSPLLRLSDPALDRAGIELRLKREDLIHPTVPGNKWRKLTLNLAAAAEQGHRRLLTFGGAYSNHIRAVAAAAAACGLASTGVIRGDELARAPRSWSLARAEADGMDLVFLDRAAYRRTVNGLAAPATRRELDRRFGPAYLLPEGGSNALAARGTAQIVAELPDLAERDLLCCPVGTGGTLAGLAAALPPGSRALGVAVLRGADGYLEGEVERLHREGWGRPFGSWSLCHTHHEGGFARVSPRLAAFAAEFETRHGIAVERHYVAKLLHCVYAHATAGDWPRGTRVTAVITGPPEAETGLQ